MRLQSALLILAIPLALMIPLLPFIVNGAPYIGDAWVHLRIAEETVRSGQYRFEDYNTQWPLVNLLLSMMILIPGIPSLAASQIVPFLAGLAVLPFYAFCRRMHVSGFASVFGMMFLTFNPLYTYFTFSGAVMKETASYYLVLTLLMVFSRRIRKREGYLMMVLLGVGLVLGHHFAAMVVALCLVSLLGYEVAGALGGRKNGIRWLMLVVGTYALVFIARNLVIYWSIGMWLPEFSLSDLLVLFSCLIVVWTLGFGESRDLSLLRVGAACSAFALSVLFLRGGILAVLTPVDPMSASEFLHFAVAGVLAMFGLIYAYRKREVRSLAVPTVGWILFAFIFSLTEAGLVIFTKALHYFGILLGLGAAFAAHVIGRLKVGKLVLVAVLLFLIYSSSFGTSIALTGLGSYSSAEVASMEHVASYTGGMNVIGDVKTSYLWGYLTKGEGRVNGIMSSIGKGDLLVVTASNRRDGFLFGQGYQWVSAQAVMQRLGRYNVIVSGSEVTLLVVL